MPIWSDSHATVSLINNLLIVTTVWTNVNEVKEYTILLVQMGLELLYGKHYGNYGFSENSKNQPKTVL